jgi:3-dehydroquinate synthase
MMKLAARSVTTRHSVTLFGEDGLAYVGKLLNDQKRRGGKTFLLVDRNTEKYCLPVLVSKISGFMPDRIIVADAGEQHKTLETASKLWQELALNGADRHSLLLNLGGGMVTDLGGFVASCFKRGIRFINIPTTLMGMADAAIGGKTAVDLDSLKNQVGTFCLPEAVAIHPVFLKTLDRVNLRSGMAEVVKSALVADAKFWKWLQSRDPEMLFSAPPEDQSWLHLIQKTAAIKHRIVRIDFDEKKERKLLNFGHTIGHAFESLMMRKGTPVSHGDAVAMGMICESWLSVRICGLDQEVFEKIAEWLNRGFGRYDISGEDIDELIRLMTYDKKNAGGRTRFTLISRPGAGVINREAPAERVEDALCFYNESEKIS